MLHPTFQTILTLHLHISVFLHKQSGIRVRRDLGNVCQNMWTAAGNNMVMGTDLTVDVSNTAKQLFTLTATGQAKLGQPVYVKFKGNMFKMFRCVVFVFLLIYYMGCRSLFDIFLLALSRKKTSN